MPTIVIIIVAGLFPLALIVTAFYLALSSQPTFQSLDEDDA